ncbi:hypothetical protein Pflav_002940 [Phytohabitans flavus]|uniref:Bacterial Ig-like domain-containing protein n=1 Tax=Phytohabitans flavus TaxID=1076124 RepID=A0A6F8XJ93_9ACTN|nr:hypothetical protein [Phytohabitans flavus]BCB73884.1 hypothetical protein Pflav_002940 [Phytohabitans flavus]
MTIKPSTTRLAWGSTLMLTATITDPRTGKPVWGGTVQFQVRKGNKWVSTGTRPVYSTGKSILSIKPSESRLYRAVYSGRGAYRATATGKVKVSVVNSRARVLAEARKHIGKPYRFGASGPRPSTARASPSTCTGRPPGGCSRTRPTSSSAPARGSPRTRCSPVT